MISRLARPVSNQLNYSSCASSEVKTDLPFSPKFRPVAPHVIAYVNSHPRRPTYVRDNSRLPANLVRTGLFFKSQYTPAERDVNSVLIHPDPLRPNTIHASSSHHEDFLAPSDLNGSFPQKSMDGKGSLNLFNQHAALILQQRASENKQKALENTVYQFIKNDMKEQRLQQVPREVIRLLTQKIGQIDFRISIVICH